MNNMLKKVLHVGCPGCNKRDDLRPAFADNREWDSKKLYCGRCDKFFRVSSDVTDLLREVYALGRGSVQKAIRKQLGMLT